jgi:hypothetical protein
MYLVYIYPVIFFFNLKPILMELISIQEEEIEQILCVVVKLQKSEYWVIKKWDA